MTSGPGGSSIISADAVIKAFLRRGRDVPERVRMRDSRRVDLAMSRLAATLFLSLVIGACRSVPAPTSQSSTPSLASDAAVPSATGLAPSPSEVASAPELPSAGGTCTAGQLVLGKATWGPGFGALGTASVYITVPLRNVGSDCVLDLPIAIGVAAATGAFAIVPVEDAGTETPDGNNSSADTARIRTGGSLSLVLGAWWWLGVQVEGGTPLPAPPCADPIGDATRVVLPLATGTVQIDLPTVLQQVCSSPASLSLSIHLG